MHEYEVCRLDQLIEGRGWPARAGDRYLAVFLVDGVIHVLDRQCLHDGSPLDGAAVVDGLVQCPWHGWAYQVTTGDLMTDAGPCPGLRRYSTAVGSDGVVRVQVDSAARD